MRDRLQIYKKTLHNLTFFKPFPHKKAPDDIQKQPEL